MLTAVFCCSIRNRNNVDKKSEENVKAAESKHQAFHWCLDFSNLHHCKRVNTKCILLKNLFTHNHTHLSYDGNLMSVLTVPPQARQIEKVEELAEDPRPVTSSFSGEWHLSLVTSALLSSSRPSSTLTTKLLKHANKVLFTFRHVLCSGL